MKVYKNYIFDLYGTLIDIKTDETKSSFWRKLAEFYNVYGCEWKGPAIRKAYSALVGAEEEALRNMLGLENVEIRLQRVFASLLFMSPKFHSVYVSINGVDVDALRNLYAGNEEDKNRTIQIVENSEFMFALANFFRIESTIFCRPYEHTANTLKELKKRGKKVFLLSNAQSIFTIPEMEKCGIKEYFDEIYISSDCEMKKPQKEFMERLIKEQGLKREECLMIGNDPDSDIPVAMKNDVDSVLLNTWNLSSEEISRRVNAHLKKEKKNKALLPRVISDGDVAKILEI